MLPRNILFKIPAADARTVWLRLYFCFCPPNSSYLLFLNQIFQSSEYQSSCMGMPWGYFCTEGFMLLFLDSQGFHARRKWQLRFLVERFLFRLQGFMCRATAQGPLSATEESDSPKVTKKVFFDIKQGGKDLGRITIGLYGKLCHSLTL